MAPPGDAPLVPGLPYRVAVLCYLRDPAGRLLLLHRRKPPNLDLYSPIGGKLETSRGESPTACAVREVREESGLDLTMDRLRAIGVVSEAAFEGSGHWLMFLFDCDLDADEADQVVTDRCVTDEGRLAWFTPEAMDGLALPETDRLVINPLVHRHASDQRFFMAHIDCSSEKLRWQQEQ